MDRFLVHQTDNTPGLHALVIGVGDYPHLKGGSDERELHGGMGQLSSPPVSARVMADWLLEEASHPEQPELNVSTVALLLSDSEGDIYRNPLDGSDHQIAPATFPNVRDAIKDWKARGDADENNLLVFFFCGHGIAQGTETSLLLRDYGADADNPLEGAIDFSGLRLGMQRCRAERQLYFIDVCRTDSPMLHSAAGFGASSVIMPDVSVPARVKSPTFYSTLQGNQAFGKAGQPSVFTNFLLKGLRGGGADDARDDDQWWISDTRLQTALNNYLNRAALKGEILAQVAVSEGVVGFDFLRLQGEPIADVYVTCTPPETHPMAILACRTEAANDVVATRDTPAEEPWDISLPAGKFVFSAEVPGKNIAEKSRDVRPPFRNVPIRVV